MNSECSTQSTVQSSSSFLEGMKDCIPTLIGYISIGVAAGIVGVSSNLSILEIVLLSALVYAGAAQFIICALLASGSSMTAIILTTFIVNIRHLLLCMTVAPYFSKYSLWKNIGIGSLITDETFGVTMVKIVKKEPMNDKWMNGLNITAYLSWILSCLAGAVFGKWISNPEQFGLDFALTAMFIALLVLQLQNSKGGKLFLYVKIIALMVIFMILFSLFLPTHISVLLSTLLVATIGTVMDR
ncbi:AzlC family ABC transporter permease [Bacillus sp. 1P06AnD]|uniref:AzlC family ABC transporter permease n=1 Tax=Bacillus sp. 1P06AnD TaxID=3132208 RepID=UPI0039A2D9E1